MPRKRKEYRMTDHVRGMIVRRETASAIVRLFMAKNLLGRDFLETARSVRICTHYMPLRLELIDILLRAGLSKSEAARAINRHPSTVVYWTLPGRRGRQGVRMRSYSLARKRFQKHQVIDTSEIPEATEAWFKKAKLVRSGRLMEEKVKCLT